jgi:hypothetical protein
MTPKEKAKDLVDKMSLNMIGYRWKLTSKECALIAINEMLKNDGWSSNINEWNVFEKYYKEVKKEIKKL